MNLIFIIHQALKITLEISFLKIFCFSAQRNKGCLSFKVVFFFCEIISKASLSEIFWSWVYYRFCSYMLVMFIANNVIKLYSNAWNRITFQGFFKQKIGFCESDYRLKKVWNYNLVFLGRFLLC